MDYKEFRRRRSRRAKDLKISKAYVVTAWLYFFDAKKKLRKEKRNDELLASFVIQDAARKLERHFKGVFLRAQARVKKMDTRKADREMIDQWEEGYYRTYMKNLSQVYELIRSFDRSLK